MNCFFCMFIVKGYIYKMKLYLKLKNEIVNNIMYFLVSFLID